MTRERSNQVSPSNLTVEDDGPSQVIKYVIFFVNVLFWFLSILVLGIGIYVMVEKRDVYSKLTDLYYDPAVIFVVFGGLLFIITFTGCIGALRENTCLLVFYAGIIIFLLILEIICGIIGFVNSAKVEEKVDEKIRNAIVFYRDPLKPDLHFLIDTAQSELGCCGSKAYTDWEANFYFNCSAPSAVISACGVPYSCCKTEELQTNRQCGYGIDKLTLAAREERVNVQGCLTVSVQFLKDNLVLIAGLSLAVIALQIISLCLALTFRGQIRGVKDRYGGDG